MWARAPALALAAALLAAASPAAAQTPSSQTVIELSPRPRATLRYLALAPDAPPRAVVVVLAGGGGVVDLPPRYAPEWGRDRGFLIRAREGFVRRGMLVAIVDAPSDHRDWPYGLGAFRLAAELARDLAAVIADLRRRAPGVPIWLVAHSRGTLSAANAAARLAGVEGPDGIVLASTITRGSPGQPETVHDAALADVALPVLIVAHRDDSCPATPAVDAARLADVLAAASPRKVTVIEGGAPRGNGCVAFAAHDFGGAEEHGIGLIADWIAAPSP
jgi:pimeloyl-ACP methyl ester carboxylesterase